MFSHEEFGFLAIFGITLVGAIALIVHAAHAHHERRQRKKQSRILSAVSDSSL